MNNKNKIKNKNKLSKNKNKNNVLTEPIIIGPLGKLPKGLIKQLNALGLTASVDLPQKACVLETARILTKVLDT